MTIAKGVGPFDLVVFGGTGDLAHRKLMPALFAREADGALPEDGHIIATGRHEMSDKKYAASLEEDCAHRGNKSPLG